MHTQLIAAVLATMALMGNVYAEEDLSICPKVSEITSEGNGKEGNLAGFTYTAKGVDGKEWTGETMATDDDFLDAKYALKAESVETQGAKVICSYGGTAVTEGEFVSKPYLKIVRQ